MRCAACDGGRPPCCGCLPTARKHVLSIAGYACHVFACFVVYESYGASAWAVMTQQRRNFIPHTCSVACGPHFRELSRSFVYHRQGESVVDAFFTHRLCFGSMRLGSGYRCCEVLVVCAVLGVVRKSMQLCMLRWTCKEVMSG